MFRLVFTLFFIFILIFLGFLGYSGFIPGVSTFFGSDKPRNLGVKYTQQDLINAQSKLRQKLLDAPIDANQKINLEAGPPIDTILTSEEFSAHIERVHPVSELQIKLVGSNFEASGKIEKTRIEQFLKTWKLTINNAQVLDLVNKYLPANPVFYIAGTGSAENNNIKLTFTKAELGRLPLPTKQLEELAELYMKVLINQITGFKVEKAFIENNQLYYKGTSVTLIPKY